MASSATSSSQPTASTASTASRAPSFPLSNSEPVPPLLNTNVQVVNKEPVELDSTPVSPVDARQRHAAAPAGLGSKKGFSPDFDDEAIDELGGGKGGGVVEREKRAALLNERSRDPAVLVNIPEMPGADELEVANRSAADAHAETAEKP